MDECRFRVPAIQKHTRALHRERGSNDCDRNVQNVDWATHLRIHLCAPGRSVPRDAAAKHAVFVWQRRRQWRPDGSRGRLRLPQIQHVVDEPASRERASRGHGAQPELGNPAER